MHVGFLNISDQSVVSPFLVSSNADCRRYNFKSQFAFCSLVSWDSFWKVRVALFDFGATEEFVVSVSTFGNNFYSKYVSTDSQILSRLIFTPLSKRCSMFFCVSLIRQCFTYERNFPTVVKLGAMFPCGERRCQSGSGGCGKKSMRASCSWWSRARASLPSHG